MLFRSGDVGRSKTRTACAWLRGWLLDNPGGTALFATEDSMLGEVKSAFDRRDGRMSGEVR